MTESGPVAPSPVPAGANRGRRRTLAGVALAAALTGAGVAWWRFQPGAADTSDWWQQDFSTPDGKTLSLVEFRGRPLVVNFWATWCPPCIQELPLLSRFFEQNNSNGWQVLGLAIDQPDAVQRFLERTPVTFPVAMAGPRGVELTRLLGNTVGGLPFSVVFDADGRLQHRKLGQLHEPDLAAWLR